MIVSSGSNSASDIDNKMAQVIAALDKFEKALEKATTAVGSGSSPTTLQAALGAVQSAAFNISGGAAANGANPQNTTSAAFGGSGIGSPSFVPSFSGGQNGALIQGTASVPFGGGQQARDAQGRFVSSGNNPSSPSPPPSRASQFGLSIAHSAFAASVGALGVYASNTASGDYDPMAAAGMWGGAAGGLSGSLIGAALSPFAPGAGGASGYSAGSQIGSALAQAAIAPFLRQRNAELSLLSVAAREGNDLLSLTGSKNGVLRKSTHLRNVAGHIVPEMPEFDIVGQTSQMGALSDLSETLSFGGKSASQKAAIKLGVYAGRDIISLQQTAETYATFGSALLAAGEDPHEAFGLTKRTAGKYYMGAPGMAKLAAPVIANQNRFGRNSTDLLMQFGPEAYGAAADALGRPDLTSAQRGWYGVTQTQEYLTSKGSLQARGAGTEMRVHLQAELADLKNLPDGEKSLYYAQKKKELRDAGRQEFDEKSITTFGIPMTKLEGQLARADVQPFSPSNIYRLSLQHIGLNEKRIGQLTDYMKQRRASGQLSETEEQSLVSDIEQAKTATAQDQARLSEGILNRMPAMLSGGGRYQARYTSPMLASMALRQMGNNTVRMFGAADGKHLAAQDAEYSDVQGGTATGARSTSAAFNNHSGSGSDGNENKAVLQVLTQIRDLLARGGGKKGGRADEALSTLDTMIKRASSSGDGSGGSFN